MWLQTGCLLQRTCTALLATSLDDENGLTTANHVRFHATLRRLATPSCTLSNQRHLRMKTTEFIKRFLVYKDMPTL